ncbi:SDR family oxidoreductase [Caballeronia sordidicola]|jgi:NAD(P)-dependent dehydrogenase (short-subunit alcohol dehydrogenase family)|uniref:Short-chain dehydrogenase/reductase SDR n=1 Tax=Caballeronia sordidicola TaxID=196367 RepID=A0A226WY44_CABSO|nr:SDR family oxidoreductase [Caballeronia sordidicola]OXC75538.1 short-chain dehydrogenase/reductase SDR [Caballeronia sordidicola]
MMHAEENASGKGRLDGKKVVVLGGSSGIGYAVAEYALAQGARVVIGSSHAGRVDAAVTALGTNAEGQVLDLTDEPAIEAFFNATGSFDHLVFTAGDSLRLGEIAGTDLSLARRAFDIRYWGALAAVKHGAPHIVAGGSIVLTTGVAALRPRSGWAFGASVCGAMDALTRALAVELAPLRVNAVSPGLIATNLWQNMSEEDRQAMYEQAGKHLPVGRVGEARDVAAAYLFLMESGFATGQTVVVDGGAVLV